jgi:hypothetical protein
MIHPIPPAIVSHAGGQSIPPAVRPGSVEFDEWRPSPAPAFDPSAEDEAEDLGYRLGLAGIAADAPPGWDADLRESFGLGNELGWLEYTDANPPPVEPDRHTDEIIRAVGVIRSRDPAS